MKLNETDKALYCIAWYNGYAKELKRIHKYLAKYGTSPRTGWIDNIHAAKKYLEALCKIK